MPFMPVFAGGTTKFQPVYVEDLASLVEILSRDDSAVRSMLDGKTIEAGGPDGEHQRGLRPPIAFSRSSFSFDVLRNDGDRAQMQEQISTYLVSALRVWNGSRFCHGETS